MVLALPVLATIPRSFIQVLTFDNGPIEEVITNSPKSTADGYTVTADILSTPGEVLSTELGRATQIRIYNLGNDKKYVMLFVQLGWFPTQWLAGDVLRIRVTLDKTGEFKEWDYKITSGTTTITNPLPNVVIPAPVYTITGSIKGKANLLGISLKCSLSKDSITTTTDKDGAYSFIVRYWESVVITPEKAGHSFTPVKLSYSKVKANISNADFVIK